MQDPYKWLLAAVVMGDWWAISISLSNFHAARFYSIVFRRLFSPMKTVISNFLTIIIFYSVWSCPFVIALTLFGSNLLAFFRLKAKHCSCQKRLKPFFVHLRCPSLRSASGDCWGSWMVAWAAGLRNQADWRLASWLLPGKESSFFFMNITPTSCSSSSCTYGIKLAKSSLNFQRTDVKLKFCSISSRLRTNVAALH